MAKHIHIHLERRTSDADAEGHWVTIHGAHVFIGKGGTIEKGPKGFAGKKVSELAEHMATKSDERGKTVATHEGKSIAGGPKGTVLVHSKPGATVAGATHAAQAGFHMSPGLASHHAERGDLAHTPGLKMAGASPESRQSQENVDRLRRGIEQAERDHAGSKGYQEKLDSKQRVHEATRAFVAAKQDHERRHGKSSAPKGPTKAELKLQARAEYDKAGKGDGNFTRAAELFDAVGDKDKAESARSLARRYGHDEAGVKLRNTADKDAAATARAQAVRAPSTKVREMLLRQASLREQMIAERDKYPVGSDAVAKELRGLSDEIAYHESQAQMGKGADLDDMRAAIRKERGHDIGIDDLNAEMEKRIAARDAPLREERKKRFDAETRELQRKNDERTVAKTKGEVQAARRLFDKK